MNTSPAGASPSGQQDPAPAGGDYEDELPSMGGAATDDIPFAPIGGLV